MGSQLPGSQGLEGQNESVYPKEMKQEPDINLRACWWREKQGEEEEGEDLISGPGRNRDVGAGSRGQRGPPRKPK